MHGRILIAFTGLAILCGCSEFPSTPSSEPEEQQTILGQSFDPATTGTIRGRVVWEGDLPKSAETLVRTLAFNPQLHKNPARFVTPHIPQVNAKTAGVENAVVFLRTVDSRRSKPWDHAKVRVEFRDRQLLVEQGQHRSQVGFVRRGGAIDVVNRDAEYHNLRASGAGFFAMPLIEPNQAHERKLPQAGVVDLACAAGYYWLNAHLFVTEHPYYARTDGDGRFTLEQVPAGTYDVVCWLPSWQVLRKEIDPETGYVARLAWADPKEQTGRVEVSAGAVGEISYTWTTRMFEK